MKDLKLLILAVIASAILYACSPAKGDFPGNEYMPDMAHSPAYEAQTYNYYYYNTWDSASTIRRAELAYPHLPVAGTIPRGYAGFALAGSPEAYDSLARMLTGENTINGIYQNVNGHVPYYYEDTPEDRLRATAEITSNPFPITERGLAQGQLLYNINCAVCHGETGNGLGYLYDTDQNPDAKYPAAPANFLLPAFVESSNGRYYHAIMYGLNVMGPYYDKLSYEERWQVIHWIRALQAQDGKLVYDQNQNTLNPAFGTPGGEGGPIAGRVSDNEPLSGQGGRQDAGETQDDVQQRTEDAQRQTAPRGTATEEQRQGGGNK